MATLLAQRSTAFHGWKGELNATRTARRAFRARRYWKWNRGNTPAALGVGLLWYGRANAWQLNGVRGMEPIARESMGVEGARSNTSEPTGHRPRFIIIEFYFTVVSSCAWQLIADHNEWPSPYTVTRRYLFKPVGMAQTCLAYFALLEHSWNWGNITILVNKRSSRSRYYLNFSGVFHR